MSFSNRVKVVLATSLTGKWPMSEDTLSDTYMMLPSVVNAIRKPSRACKEEKLMCEGVNENAYHSTSHHL